MSTTPRPIPIRWTCGVVPGHEHRTFEAAEVCILRHTISAPYGWCPEPGCTKRGISRERRPDGNDRCEAGHTYPSRDAIPGVG